MDYMKKINPIKGDCLLVIDLQPDFYAPDGALYVPGGSQINEGILLLSRKFETVVATQDWHPKDHVSFASTNGKQPFSTIKMYGHDQVMWPDHCVQSSHYAELPHWLADRADMILRKGKDPKVDSYSAFQENYGPDGKRKLTGLQGWMLERVVRRIFVCGLARDFCVMWSAQDIATVIPTYVIWDLTRAVSPQNDEETRLKMGRSDVKII
jgi:nicotinamidase/pyrazinamidase